ncbi:hypothetical protein SPFM15_00171 [Salmonella phage SPFM15]|nr:hypothetical protein SPFM5_00166 [Salmonella phage SPFM5]VFR13795.1 hypothetical protein SPFM15_00171 [Salmonella phage SPFM15]
MVADTPVDTIPATKKAANTFKGLPQAKNLRVVRADGVDAKKLNLQGFLYQGLRAGLTIVKRAGTTLLYVEKGCENTATYFTEPNCKERKK